jgi:hypothetical protein
MLQACQIYHAMADLDARKTAGEAFEKTHYQERQFYVLIF